MTETRAPDTLLAHLAEKLSHHHEDIAVEALGYIFQSRAARRVMEEVLRDGGAEVDRSNKCGPRSVRGRRVQTSLVLINTTRNACSSRRNSGPD